MKVYSIGRDVACNIVINDNTDVISRRHAILNVSPSGKMTIVDQSHNGTYVNGIRISSNVPVPVTRKDNISFAHVARLDWNMIPNTRAKIIRYILLAIVAFVFVVCGILGLIFWGTCSAFKGIIGGNEKPGIEVVDSPEHKKDTVAGKPVVTPPDTCKTCKKVVTECPYNGQHPAICKTCKKVVTECPYNGQHPAMCKTCGKKITDCKYKGKHPAICKTCKKEVTECPYKGKHPAQPTNPEVKRPY